MENERRKLDFRTPYFAALKVEEIRVGSNFCNVNKQYPKRPNFFYQKWDKMMTANKSLEFVHSFQESTE